MLMQMQEENVMKNMQGPMTGHTAGAGNHDKVNR
jgi:hypothetical protein